MENDNTSALIILLIFIGPVILWYLGYLWVSVRNWLNKADTDEKYINKYTYIKKEQYFKGNNRVEREHPPNASFFCRVDGKETSIEGPYEEQFLTKIEKFRWENKKREKKMKKGRGD